MSSESLFLDWLGATMRLQSEAYKVDYDTLWSNKPEDLRKLIEYVRWNMLAIDDELAEMRQAISWKPWQHDEPYADREEVIKEAVDVLHFVANIICAMGTTDAEFSTLYQEKMTRNKDRQLGGYKVKDAGKKCALCTRAIDDVGASTLSSKICAKCELNGDLK